MPERKAILSVLDRTESYLTDVLLPFWIEHSPDREYGGFLTYFDRNGKPTGETVKTFLMQIRMLYTMASAHRAGYGGGRCAELAWMGADFILDHYWDSENEGWVWIADRRGQPTQRGKIGYGQCFAELFAVDQVEHLYAVTGPELNGAIVRHIVAVYRQDHVTGSDHPITQVLWDGSVH